MQGPSMCMGLPDSCFWFWSLYLKFRVLPESPLSACTEPPHRNAPLGTGQDEPDKMQHCVTTMKSKLRQTRNMILKWNSCWDTVWMNTILFHWWSVWIPQALVMLLQFYKKAWALTKSDDCLLSSHMVDIPWTVVLMSGNVCSIVSSLVVPFVVGGRRCREMGALGIQPP